MTKTVVCELDEKVLRCASTDADRLVFSQYFVPVVLSSDEAADEPLLPRYQLERLRAYHELLGAPRFAKAVDELKMPALLTRVVQGMGEPHNRPQAPADPVSPGDWAAVRDDVRELSTLVRAATEPGAMVSSELGELITRRLERLERLTLEGAVADVAHHDASAPAVVVGGLRAVGFQTAEEAVDLILNLLKSEIGYVFLDRTRIRPTGFAIGEHIFSLSLAPGEEVVVEQKTFSKRETTYEEQTEHERQLDLELSSTLSTELQEGTERQKSVTASEGWNVSGSVGGVIKGVTLSANAGYSKNVTEANSQSARRSLKDTSTATSKVASKYRAMHKTIFKVAQEERFELTSKRTLRNPNRFVPIDLHYFKVLQVLELSQERYGVRLCWAPSVRDPAFELMERIRLGKKALLDEAENVDLPPRPVEPQRPQKPPVTADSGPFAADKWGVMCDMRYDYEIAIQIPAGYVWDGDGARVKKSLTYAPTGVDRGNHYYVIGEPWVRDGAVILKVHVGVDWKSPVGGCGTIYLRATANCIPDPAVEDPQYRQDYAAWQGAVTKWTEQVAQTKAEARSRSETAAVAWEAEMLARVNPIGELLHRLVAHSFPPAVRDESWEVDLWRQVFDWSQSSYFLYPGWWSDLPLRDPTKDPADFLNASWARLYLPVRPQFERTALRWIFAKVVETGAEPRMEEAFTRLEGDLKRFRRECFGAEDETVVEDAAPCPKHVETIRCLGRWTELMPTDGTHVEVVQAMTTAIDPLSDTEMADSSRLRAARIESELQDIELKKKALAGMKQPTSVEVRIETERHEGVVG
jgi:hypothetical protein